MTEYTFLIPLAPATKKNSGRIAKNREGRPFLLPSAQYERFMEAAGYFLRPKPPEPIGTPVICRYTFFMPTHRRVDELNLSGAMDDILVHYGILKDDNRNVVAGHDGTRVYYDKQNPRVEILIYPAEAGYKSWKEGET